MKIQQVQRKKHTGRNLILLHSGLKTDQFFKAAHNASVKMARFKDFREQPEKFSSAFTDADGIYFDELHVAVLNFNKEDEISFMNRKLASEDLLFTEPERFIYKIESYEYLRGYRDGMDNFISKFGIPDDKLILETPDSRKKIGDTENASWGIRATNVLGTPYTGKGIRIAILDTGVYRLHRDLKGRKITTKKFVPTGSSGDVDGHGSHCTGIACGFTNESGLRYGVAFESEIFCGKVLNDDGEGTDGSILAGIEWAVSNRCQVISMSLGAATTVDEPYSETYENVARRALKMGTLLVAAAGNESDRPDYVAPVGHPANCPSVMAVGAINSSLGIAPFSCGGINKNGGQVDIAAPGVGIYSMINGQNQHEKWDGTSMATPFAAGIAGLYFQQDKTNGPLDVWAKMTQHAKRMKLGSADVGSGLVQAPEEYYL